MKKYLFWTLLCLLFVGRATADEVTLSKCGGDTSQQGLGLSGYSSISAATNFSPSDLAPYTGGTITHLRCYIATTTNMKSLKLWVKNKAGDLRTLSSVTVSSPVVGWNEVALATPVSITGDAQLCIGYTFTQTSSKPCYALTFSSFSSEGGCILGRGSSYQDVSGQYGNVSIEATVTGVTVEGRSAEVTKVVVDKSFYQVSQQAVAHVTFANRAAELSSVTLRLVCGRETIDKTVDALLPFGTMGEADIPFTTPAEANGDTPLSVCIVALDGEPYEGTPMETTFSVYSRLYERNVLVEEGTGTWCQWCVRGIVAMEQMYERHPDSFIGIAVHSGDAMAINGYINYLGIPGFPGCTIDRAPELKGLGVDLDSFEEYYRQERSRATYADFSLQAQIADGMIEATAEAVFEYNKQQADLRMVYVVTEDGVTGYSQQNAYAGGSYGPMGGFESKPSVVSDQVFNDVARAIFPSFYGEQNSLCADIVAGQEYSHHLSVPVPQNVQSAERLSLTAMLLDGRTGEVLQVRRVRLSRVDDGVGSVSASDGLSAAFERGELLITGLQAGEAVTVCDASGRLIATASGAPSLRIPVRAAALLIVRTSAGRTAKVAQ